MDSDGGYFPRGESVLRAVHEERIVGVLYGQRALLLQAMHPDAFEGLIGDTKGLDAPFRRLVRTAKTMERVYFGSCAEADRVAAGVRRMHERVPAATVQEHLLWILACLADSAAAVYQRYVAALSGAEREALWGDYRIVGRQFGLREADLPPTWDALEAYVLDMVEGEDLHVTDAARSLAVQIVMRPPVPLRMRPVLELANQITIGLLPPRLRRQYGFAWDPVRAVAIRGGAEYAKRFVVPFLPERLRVVRSARRAA
jgi:uncharacterized protein (DUF2236 family)